MINWRDDKDIFGRLGLLTENSFLNDLRNTVEHYDIDFSDALSWGQLKSKRWLIQMLQEYDINLGTVFLCGGWWATLARMMLDSDLKIEKIRSFDIDNTCAVIAESVNKTYVKDEWKFKASTLDIHHLRYEGYPYTTYRADKSEVELVDTADTIINTSCEHIEDFYNWFSVIPNNKLIVLQSNDFKEIDEHVNCSDDLESFSAITPMSKILYEGELFLPEYTRFMKIGYK